MTKITLPSKRQVGHLTLLRQGRNISLAEYNALTADEQLSMIHQAQGKQKYDLILNSKNNKKLVPKLHPQELYLMVNELGAEYSTELLALATPEQLTTLLDLDCWDHDNLSPILSLHWLELLLGTGEEKVCQLAREMDPEILALFLKKHLFISRGLEAYDDDDAENAKRLEGVYDIQYSSENAAKVIGAILKIWMELEQQSYLYIMEKIRGENATVLEEEVYQARSNRLLDLGIIPAIEAKEIYSYRDPDTFVPGGKSDFHLEAEDLQHPAALLACAHPNNLLAELLSGGIDHATASELLFLANRKMSADNIDVAEAKYVSTAFQSTYDTLNLALEFLAGSDIDKAEEIFKTTYLLHLFQVGNSLIKKLQDQAEKIRLSSIYPYLDYPELLFIDSLLQNPPYFYQEAFEEKSSNLQPITTTKELKRIERRLAQVESLQELFTTILPFKLPAVAAETDDDERPSLSGIFLTAVANQLLEREFTPAPLTTADLPLLREKSIVDDQISATFCADISESMHQLAPECDFFVRFCLDVWDQIFLDLEPLTEQSPVFNTLLIADQD
ncbi:hypothetical protein SAMN05660420_01296 [Desulfuromusa kysingii]|uniref:Uncharacterized protein n=1 Tax=Desulfuromusa kysingii TaxID=37625 RepID=A0A1H3YLW0_9BACT|nr:DUF6178 family protein [Desulfuromusa kysingii]SEA12589.1 hypothetical protein SAMN05660420_01296 [Desulfuromusa kysingii]